MVGGKMIIHTCPSCGDIHDKAIPSKMNESQVRQWFQFLLGLGVNFHPDDRGADIVKYGISNDERMFTDEGANAYDAIMADAHRSLGDKVYDIAIEVLNGA
jgi:hypothetical protein